MSPNSIIIVKIRSTLFPILDIRATAQQKNPLKLLDLTSIPFYIPILDVQIIGMMSAESSSITKLKARSENQV